MTTDGFGLYVATQTPTAWWRMAQATGASSPDRMGSGVPLDPTGTVTDTRVAGYTALMNGHRFTTNGYYSTAQHWTPTRTWTLAAWLKYEAEPQNYVALLGVETTDRSFVTGVQAASQTYLTRTGVGNIGLGGPKASVSTAWRLWVMTGGVNDAALYVDGTNYVHNTTDTFDITGGSGNFFFVVGQEGNAGQGCNVGDVMYWNHQFSSTEVTNLWNARSNPDGDLYSAANSPMVL